MFFKRKRKDCKYIDTVAREELQKLVKKFMCGISSKDDIVDWEKYLKALKPIMDIEDINTVDTNTTLDITSGIEDLFIDYLLYHHPDDQRIKGRFETVEDIEIVRGQMFRRIVTLALGESLLLINAFEYPDIIREIEEYVYFKNDNWGKLFITAKCLESKENTLLELLGRIKKCIPQTFKKEKEWHLRVDNLDTFKVNNKD